MSIDRLRVVDASIMPKQVTGNLNPPTLMMALKLADKIKGTEMALTTVGCYRSPG
jgi:choline dehydrogenase